MKKEQKLCQPSVHLLGLHNTGRFSCIAKATWLQVYLKEDECVVHALQMLLDEAEVMEGMVLTLTSFVCAAYTPNGINIKTIPALLCHLFCNHMADSDKLPPTLLESSCQTRVWSQAAIALQEPQLLHDNMPLILCKTGT